ncbi:hypothetical protein [Lysobacter hankyongensis]|uniref:Uncharacterized protein n=1 Tax=Lysobacter hankyongensis TaxID=1176535 RepID=A0ABP9AJE1_9GAMM
MTTQEPISPELQAKIDALPEGSVKERIIRALTGPGTRTASNEVIFETIMKSVAQAQSQRAQWRQWRDDEVMAFVEYFKQELPEDYVEYLRQERENNEIDSDLSWRVRRLVDKWIPELTYADNGNLVSKVRHHLQTQLREMREESP